MNDIKKELQSLKNPIQAKILQRFFKTGIGEYGEGDIFFGIKVPILRQTAKKYFDINLREVEELLKSEIHEYRLIALFILVKKYELSKNETSREKIFKIYIKNKRYINNWDLVDLSAPNIVGNYLLNKDRNILYNFAKSDHLWTKRIAMLSCYTFIKNGETKDTLKIAEILLNDKHDLIQKAVGWMLRELGKRVSQNIEEEFLKKYYQKMPRTTLRYSIERFSDKKKKFYMSK
ncbi:MAG: DNA alkylation repair protein [Patescibacteria group bacterium]|nr:DNA alkylation repair protein [Patescibacteria group bacterium]MDD4304032.1 DNA alkylation repair protein [Patescibacteria group bacterium]MDD4694909.1 DNA alkylation repair protein [Patescibacteria group bacterium]